MKNKTDKDLLKRHIDFFKTKCKCNVYIFVLTNDKIIVRFNSKSVSREVNLLLHAYALEYTRKKQTITWCKDTSLTEDNTDYYFEVYE